MKINKVKLYNFSSYEGNNEFDFEITDAEKNIVLHPMEILSDIFPDGSTQYRRSTKFPSSSCSQYITYFSSAQSYIARKCFILKKNSRSSSFFSNFLFLSRNDDIPIERYSRYSGG